VEQSLPFVDAHVHFWDRGAFRYDWLQDTDLPFRFLPGDLDVQPEALVFVQADCAPEQGLAEAEWASTLVRAQSPQGAVVAYAPIEDAVALPGWIDRLRELPAVVGVRRLLQDEPDDLLRSDEVAAGLRRLGGAGLTFDACVRHGQLPALLELVRAAQMADVVLDHMGKPPVRDGWASAAARSWHESIQALAAEPRTTVKLSGLALEAAPGPLLEQAVPFVSATIDAFGPERCMLGSDFPVSAAPADAVPYATWFTALSALVDTASDRDALLRGTALRVYGAAGRS
jgi:L-fuconolactonase